MNYYIWIIDVAMKDSLKLSVTRIIYTADALISFLHPKMIEYSLKYYFSIFDCLVFFSLLLTQEI